MTDSPKAPASGFDEPFELEDTDFHPVEPTGKIKLTPQALGTAAAKATPTAADVMQIVTGEIEVERTPAPVAPRPMEAISTDVAAMAKGGKAARHALQDALAQLQKSKATADAAAGRPQVKPRLSPEEDMTPLPSVSPFAAPWQAAVTSEVVLGPSSTPADAMPTGQNVGSPSSAQQDAAAMRITGEMQVPQASRAAATSAPPVAASPAPAGAQRPAPSGAPRPALAASSATAGAPRPVLQGAPRPVLAGAPRPAAAAAAPMHLDHEATTPTPIKAPPAQDLPFQRPILTPLAGLPEADKSHSQTTEVALSEAMPDAAQNLSQTVSGFVPQTPDWAAPALADEAPALMDLLPQTPIPEQLAPPPPDPFAPMTQDMDGAQMQSFTQPEMPQEDEVREPRLEELADEATAASPPPEAATDFAALTAQPGVTARSPTAPLEKPFTQRPTLVLKHRPQRWLPWVAGAAILAVAAAVVVRQHHVVKPHKPVVAHIEKPAAQAKPVAHEPHKEKTHAPKPVVPAVTEALTADNVDHLGYHALAAGVDALANHPPRDPSLLLWAQFRLASRFEDPQAKAALIRAVDALPLRGRVDVSSPLLTAAQAGAAITLGRVPLAKRLLIGLAKSPGATRWQSWYVQALWQTRRPLPPARLIMQLDRILHVAPAATDVRLWRAETLLRRSPTEGTRALTDLARQKDPDVIARIAQVFVRRGLTQALGAVLEPLEDGSIILQAAPAHQADLLRLYAASRILRADYEAPRNIAEALARGNGDATSVAIWARLTQYQGDDPGSVLQQGIDAQSDKMARGWLLYEAVRLALARNDDNHAKFLADGMNSMPAGDIGVFAPLAAARLAQEHHQLKQAKHHIAQAVAQDATNRQVQIAQTLIDSTQEVPVAWSGAPPLPPEVLWQRAHAAAAMGQGSSAARLAEELFWRDPTLFDPVVLLGAWSAWLEQAGEALHAESLLERIVQGLPDDDRPVIQLIKQAKRGKRYDAAIQWYEVLLKRRPSDPELTVDLAKTYIDAQRPDAAARVLASAEHADPNVRTPVFMTTMAGALSHSDPTRARNLLAVALRVQPSADSYVLLADMENAAGHPEEELRALQAALPFAPDDGPLHLRVATMLRDKGQANQAMVLLQPLTSSAEAMEMLGDLLQASGDVPDAMTAYQHADTAYQRADTARPDQAGLLVKIAVLQLNGMHNANAAIKTLQRAVSMAPRHADTFFWLSRAFARSGMHNVSKKLLGKYLHLAPDGPHAEEARQELGNKGRPPPATE